MQCMEIRGGNRAIEKSFAAPGLDLHVWCEPYASSATGGGDLYYLTSCASGRITRLMLADVAGHGEPASEVARGLRDLLRENVNAISQEALISGMNRQFGRLPDSHDGRFATAVVATFFEPRRSLSLGLAGHPLPLYYQANARRWLSVIPGKAGKDQVGNVPLGIVDEAIYPERDLTSAPGDMFLLYSDAFIEARNDRGDQLGTRGLSQILNQNPGLTPEEVIPWLRSEIVGMDNSNLSDDDATAILGHVTPRRVRFRDNLLAPFRLMGQTRDHTEIE